MFLITSQWNGEKFNDITCNADPDKDPNYGAYVTGNILIASLKLFLSLTLTLVLYGIYIHQ